MPQGIEIYNEYGNIQASDSLVSLGLASTNTVTLTDDGVTHPQPIVAKTITVTGTNPILAIKPTLGKMVTVDRVSASGSTFVFYLLCQSNTPVSVSYWIFDTAGQSIKDPTLSNCGAQAFDEFGVLTWDASYSALRVVGAVSVPVEGQSENFTGFTVPAGKTYAIVQSLHGYITLMRDTGAYSNSDNMPEEMLPDDPGNGPPLGAKWRQMILEGYRSMGGYTSSNYIEAGLGRFEFFQGWYPIGQAENYSTYGQITFIIVDVTDFLGYDPGTPVGVTGSVNATTRDGTGSPDTTIISPAVNLTPSGGTAPYTVLWQYVSGATVVTNYDATNATSFRLQSPTQPAGQTRSTIWRAKITDANNVVGYGPDVTFNFTTASVDVTPNAVNWTNISASSNDASTYTGHNNQTINGINQPIVLRATISNVSSTNIYLAGSRLDFWKNGGYVHDTSGIGNGYWTEAPFNNEDYGGFIAHVAAATVGVGTVSYTVTVTNQSANGAVLDTFTVNQTVYANYVAADYTMNAPSLSAKNAVSDANYVQSVGSFTVSGINQPIFLQWTMSNYSSNATQTFLDVYVNYVFKYRTSGGNGHWSGVLVNNGDFIEYVHYIDTDGGRRTASYNVTLTNETNGTPSQNFGTYSVSLAADNDDNYDRVRITFGNCDLSTPSHYGDTTYSLRQVSGLTRAHTLQFTRDNVNTMYMEGNIVAGRQIIGHSPGGTGGPWTWYTLGAGVGASVNITVNNGDGLYVHGYVETSAGIARAAWSTYVNDLTTGEYLGSWYTNGLVDTDNNYNVVPAPTATLLDGYLSNYQFASQGEGITTTAGSTSVSITNGTAPFQIYWEKTSGLSGWSINVFNGGTSAQFSYYGTTNYNVSGTFRARVVDAQNRTAYSDEVYCEAQAGNQNN